MSQENVCVCACTHTFVILRFLVTICVLTKFKEKTTEMVYHKIMK